MSTRVLLLAAAALLLCGTASAAFGTTASTLAPYATIGTRILGYTYITDQAPYTVDLGQDECEFWDMLAAGNRSQALELYVQGKYAVNNGFSWANMTRTLWPGEMYNDMIVAAFGLTGITDAIFSSNWTLDWGPLHSGIRSPFFIHRFAAKGKEMLHQLDQAYMDTYIVETGNRTALTGAGTHPWAAHHLDIGYGMWAGNETNACPQATMGYVSNSIGADMGTIYRGMSLQNAAMERTFNQAQYYAKKASSSGVWASGFSAATIQVELGLQMVLHGTYVMDFGKACNASAVAETGKAGVRDVFPFTLALLRGLAKAGQGADALPAIDKLNMTIMTDSWFTYDRVSGAVQSVISMLPSTFGLEYKRLGGPPTTASTAPSAPFWWLYAAYPNCTGKPKH